VVDRQFCVVLTHLVTQYIDIMILLCIHIPTLKTVTDHCSIGLICFECVKMWLAIVECVNNEVFH